METIQGLLQYLQDGYFTKKGPQLSVEEWDLIICTADTPMQQNGKMNAPTNLFYHLWFIL